MEKIVYLSGRESFVVSVIVTLALILFIIPLVLIFFLRFLYRSYAALKEQAIKPENLIYKLEHQY